MPMAHFTSAYIKCANIMTLLHDFDYVKYPCSALHTLLVVNLLLEIFPQIQFNKLLIAVTADAKLQTERKNN